MIQVELSRLWKAAFVTICPPPESTQPRRHSQVLSPTTTISISL